MEAAATALVSQLTQTPREGDNHTSINLIRVICAVLNISICVLQEMHTRTRETILSIANFWYFLLASANHTQN